MQPVTIMLPWELKKITHLLAETTFPDPAGVDGQRRALTPKSDEAVLRLLVRAGLRPLLDELNREVPRIEAALDSWREIAEKAREDGFRIGVSDFAPDTRAHGVLSEFLSAKPYFNDSLSWDAAQDQVDELEETLFTFYKVIGLCEKVM